LLILEHPLPPADSGQRGHRNPYSRMHSVLRRVNLNIRTMNDFLIGLAYPYLLCHLDSLYEYRTRHPGDNMEMMMTIMMLIIMMMMVMVTIMMVIMMTIIMMIIMMMMMMTTMMVVIMTIMMVILMFSHIIYTKAVGYKYLC
jgi:hypothetical protein